MFSPSLLAFAFGACMVNLAKGATISDLSKVKTSYDYIVIGGGTAGLTVASRLSENPYVSVLVLEAGPSDSGLPLVTAPFLAPSLTPNTALDWNYTVTPQTGMNNRTFPYVRGRLLGGCSSVNYMFHQYGSTEDWDRYAAVTGDPGWAWSNMRQYVKKHEHIVPPVDGHDTSAQIIPSLHGTSGNVAISLPGFNESSDARVYATTQQLAEFPYNPDTSGIDRPLLGTGFVQSSINNGVRSSSSTAYLGPANSRPNLTVVVSAMALKLFQTGVVGGVKAFRGVQYSSAPQNGQTPVAPTSIFQVTANKEVIVSAGAINSVQLLQLSGIGNAADLTPLNIPVLVNSPRVGKNVQEHTFLPIIWNAKGTASVDHILQDSAQLQGALNQFFTNQTGMIADNVSNQILFARIPANSTILKTNPDPAPGPNSPHYEFFFGDFHVNPAEPEPTNGSFFTVAAVILNPTSRGSTKISSANPFAKPLYDPAVITTNFDVVVMREAVKAAYRFMSAPAWADYITGPVNPVSTDAQIDAFVRSSMYTIYHASGSLGMTTASASVSSGVLNPNFTVKNTIGLRVVDASAFPYVPSSHPQGPIYMLAERASDLIKASA